MIAKTRRWPALPRDEETALIVRAQAGDREAQAALIAQHTPFLWRCVGNIRRTGSTLDTDDLYQEAVIGLLHAITKFRIEEGKRLSTYIYLTIPRWLWKVVRLSTLVRVPEKPGPDYQGKAAAAMSRPSSLSEPDVMKRAADRRSLDPTEVAAARDSERRFLARIRRLLDKKRFTAITLRSQGMTRREVGQVLGVSTERARILEEDARAKLIGELGLMTAKSKSDV